MTHAAPALRISALQQAWLQELGIPKPMLARYLPGPQALPRTPTRPERLAGALPASGRGGAHIEPQAVPVGQVSATRPAELPHDLPALRVSAEQCRACSLCEGRSHVVFGDGITQSPAWMVVGEAPGDHDDRSGLPFQGDAGMLLTRMLRAIGVVAGESVYFANLVKCRPLGNRPPSPDEIASCLPYLQRQIALLAPRRILALGRVAAQVLTGDDADFEQLRGDSHSFLSEAGARIPMVITYHPASLLLQPQHKLDAWRDLNRARSMMDAD